MKKVIILGMMCLMALTMNAQSYVDLGLPSGTKWKTTNEKKTAAVEYDYFTHKEAISQFGKSLPTIAQWKELKDECQWSWTGCGYKVTGPNGNSITLPAAGCGVGGGKASGGGRIGRYRSRTVHVKNWTIRMIGFDSISVNTGYQHHAREYSVRLVQDQ